MKEGMIIGIMLGMIAGAIIVQSNKKAADLVEMGKEKLKEEINKI